MNYTQKKLNLMLRDSLVPHHFTQRGSAFFRCIGDGVLQIVKFKYEPHGSFYELALGLHSMYSPLDAQWLTSRGCVPIYNISNLVGEQSAFRTKYVVQMALEKFQIPKVATYIVPPEEQSAILMEYGIPWLDRIKTQRQLAASMCQIEKKVRAVSWNDVRKIEPFLACGEYAYADYVIFRNLHLRKVSECGECITQPWAKDVYIQFEETDSVGRNPFFDVPTWTQEEYTTFQETYAKRQDLFLLRLHAWIQCNDTTSIYNYLRQNYEANKALTAFIKK